MTFSAGELLTALEPLPHSARLRYTAVTARRLAARDELRPLLAELDTRGPYERRLAALAALTAGDVEYIGSRLGDPDPVVRRYALRGARRLPVPDSAVEAAHADAPPVVRADLARLLRDGRRSALAERLVLRVRDEYGDHDAARLLAGCSAEFTARLLPELAGALAYEDWSTVAVRHPLAVLDQAERELDDLPEQLVTEWWTRHAVGVAAALPACPARVLDLLERYGPGELPGPVHDMLGDLVAADAERVAGWLADPGRRAGRWERTPGRAAVRRLVAADPPSLPRLGARWLHREAFGRLLRVMPPARRSAFLDAVVAEAGPRGNVHARTSALALLPAPERHSRARAEIEALRGEHGSDWTVRGLLALLPPTEARPRLMAALRTGDAEERGSAWDSLVANAGHSGEPQRVADVLALAADRLANDRDPVRDDALSALAALPGPLLAAALAAEPATAGGTGATHLERLCLAALDARDRSATTTDTIRRLTALLLATGEARETRRAPEAAAATTGAADAKGTEGPAVALRTAARLTEALTIRTGTVELGCLGTALRESGLRVVLDALGPWFERAASQGDFTPLLSFVRSCGPRARRMPELQSRLEQALHACPDAVFGEIAEAWLADPASRGVRAAVLLEREPSAAHLPQVLAVLAGERTDLLDAALSENPRPAGRFPVPGTPRPLPPFRYADRWLPRQQEAAVRLAAAVVADPGRGLDERAALLRAAAPVPVYGKALLRRYAPAAGTPSALSARPAAGPADTAEPATAPAEAALTAAALDALARTDDPAAALATLLDHAGDDRAAAAWSAAGRAADHARPSRLAELLSDVLTRESGVKVTVRKAAARLAARRLPPATATALLARVGRAPDVHPDVHATVVGLAATLLPHEDMWALLESAVAAGPDAARRALLGPSPADLAPEHRPRYGQLVAGLPFVADEQTAQDALSALGDWARYTPAAGTALVRVCSDPSLPRTLVWRADSGLTALAGSAQPHPVGGVRPGSLLRDAVDRLLLLVAAGESQGGGAGEDLPARRRLESLIGSYAVQDHRMCAALARRLATEPSLDGLRTTLLVRAVDLTAGLPELLGALRELTAAVDGRPVLATRVAERLEETHRYGGEPVDLDTVLAAVDALGGDGGLVEGLLAVGLATAVGKRRDWPEECRTAVVTLRRHPEREVREAAYGCVLSES
ncbi:hypothetical protein [Streptomyces sp. NPDC008150]|uniref:hypothetical protein n=1 Tax=Streptomyces sp. NPDC008150 TaxID=3364816 RepID=UPI0036E3CC47